MKDYNQKLITACRTGDKKLVLHLISLVENNRGLVKSLDWDDGLTHACFNGHKELVDLMLKKGATNFNHSMVYACSGGHKDIVLLMIEKGADDWDNGLYYACYSKKKDLAILMLEKGASFRQYFNFDPPNDIIYYLVQKGRKKFGRYSNTANSFIESQYKLSAILKGILNKDLILEILTY